MATDLKDWPFKDARSTCVFTSKSVARGETWIQFVSHDAEDGAWQFHPPGDQTPEESATVVSLLTIFRLDASIADLADLQTGWWAERASTDAPWVRHKEAPAG